MYYWLTHLALVKLLTTLLIIVLFLSYRFVLSFFVLSCSWQLAIFDVAGESG